MTLLGLSSYPKHSGSAKVSVSAGWLRGVLVVGLGAGGGVAGLLGAYEMIQAQPKESFDLLAHWGPWFGVAVFAIYVLSRFLSEVNINGRRALDMIVETARDNAVSQNRMADAMTKIAEKDDRQLMEIQTLSGVNVQQNSRLMRKMEQQDRTLERIEDKLGINHSLKAAAEGSGL